MERFAEIGDEVIYTGNVKYADDDRQASLMRNFFRPGCRYVVREIDKEHKYYRFYGYLYPYPCKCFVKETKEIFEDLYNLK